MHKVQEMELKMLHLNRAIDLVKNLAVIGRPLLHRYLRLEEKEGRKIKLECSNNTTVGLGIT